MSKESITIDSVEHLIEDLSKEQQAIVMSINEADKEQMNI
jgi:hypothetical protein